MSGPQTNERHASKVAPKTMVQATTKHERSEFGSVRKSVLFLGAVMVVYILYVIFSGQMDEFVSSLRGVDITWVLRGGLCMFFYYILGVVGYAVPVAREKRSPLGFRDLMSVEAAGIFFSFLSPGGTGAAPAQIYRLTRAGLSVGASSALQYTRFIVYEAAEGIFAAIMLIFRYRYFIDTVGNFAVIGLVLFGMKIVEVFALLVICLCPGFVLRAGNGLINLLGKTPIKADFVHWHSVVDGQVQEFSDGFKDAAKDLPMMLLALFVSLLQLGCQYALAWFVAHAFGKSADLVTCLAAGSMLELLTSAIPLPGGALGAEGGFAMLFHPIFGSTITAAYVVWRFIEYIGPIVAMVPLLGLRSRGGCNVYQRLARIRQGLDTFRRGLPGQKGHEISGGIKITPKTAPSSGRAKPGRAAAPMPDSRMRDDPKRK